jgi:hypothetical protein
VNWKPMDPNLVRQLIQDQEDIITPLVKAENERYKKLHCPICRQDGCKKRIKPPKVIITEKGQQVVESPFGSSPLPYGYAVCSHCDTEFDPETGVIYKTKASTLPSSQSDPLP